MSKKSKTSNAAELVASYDPHLAERSLEYFSKFAQLRQEENPSDDDELKAVLTLGEQREFRSSPRGDLGIVQRHMKSSGKTADEITKGLTENKLGLSKPQLS